MIKVPWKDRSHRPSAYLKITGFSGHRFQWAQVAMGTDLNAHRVQWAQVSAGTGFSGHRFQWAQVSAGTGFSGRRPQRAQVSAGTGHVGHKRTLGKHSLDARRSQPCSHTATAHPLSLAPCLPRCQSQACHMSRGSQLLSCSATQMLSHSASTQPLNHPTCLSAFSGLPRIIRKPVDQTHTL